MFIAQHHLRVTDQVDRLCRPQVEGLSGGESRALGDTRGCPDPPGLGTEKGQWRRNVPTATFRTTPDRWLEGRRLEWRLPKRASPTK